MQTWSERRRSGRSRRSRRTQHKEEDKLDVIVEVDPDVLILQVAS